MFCAEIIAKARAWAQIQMSARARAREKGGDDDW